MEDSSVEVNILFFAKSKELTGKSVDAVNLRKSNCLENLLKEIILEYPALNILKGKFIIAHNQAYLRDTKEIVILETGDEIAIIPPISGG